MFRTDRFFFKIGMWIWIPLVLAGIWFARTGFAEYSHLLTCSIRQHTGIPCPSCGGTRALYYFLQGHIWKSITYNPIVVYVALAYLHFMFFYAYRKYITKTIADQMIIVEIYIYIGIAVLVLQWLVSLIYI